MIDDEKNRFAIGGIALRRRSFSGKPVSHKSGNQPYLPDEASVLGQIGGQRCYGDELVLQAFVSVP